MTPDDAHTCLNAIMARWRYQPMSEDEKRAWLRTLRKLDLVTFGEVLDLFVCAGGSRGASQPGQRPSVAEFMGTAESVARTRRQSQEQTEREAEPWPHDPEATSRHVAELRERYPDCWRQRKAVRT